MAAGDSGRWSDSECDSQGITDASIMTLGILNEDAANSESSRTKDVSFLGDCATTGVRSVMKHQET